MKLTVRDASVFWCFIGCCYWPFGCCGACFDWLATSQRPCSSAHAVCNRGDTETLGSKPSTLVALEVQWLVSFLAEITCVWFLLTVITLRTDDWRRNGADSDAEPPVDVCTDLWWEQDEFVTPVMKCFIGGDSLFSERLQTHGCCHPHHDRRFPEHLHRNKHEDCCRAVTHIWHADQP